MASVAVPTGNGTPGPSKCQARYVLSTSARTPRRSESPLARIVALRLATVYLDRTNGSVVLRPPVHSELDGPVRLIKSPCMADLGEIVIFCCKPEHRYGGSTAADSCAASFAAVSAL